MPSLIQLQFCRYESDSVVINEMKLLKTALTVFTYIVAIRLQIERLIDRPSFYDSKELPTNFINVKM